MYRKVYPEAVTHSYVATLPKSATVQEAVRLMTQSRIGSVVVMDQGRITGIFTEHDVMTRVVNGQLNPEETLLWQVMTPNPDLLTQNDTVRIALECMVEHGYRHLPIVDESGRPVGMVSSHDLYRFVQQELERDIQARNEYIFGTSYSALSA